MALLVGFQWVCAVLMILAGISGLVQTQDAMPAGPAIMAMLIGVVLLPPFNRFVTDNKRRAVKYGAVLVLIVVAGSMMPPTAEQLAANPTAAAPTPTPKHPLASATPAPSKIPAAPAVKATVAPKPTPKPTAKPTKAPPKATAAPAVNQAKALQAQIDAIYTEAKALEGNYQAAAEVYKKAIQLQPDEPSHYYFAGQQFASMNDTSPDAEALYTRGIEVGLKNPQKHAQMLGMLYGMRAEFFKYARNCPKPEADFKQDCKYSEYSQGECAERLKIHDCRGYLQRSGG